MKAVNRWIDEDGKATLVGAPDVDILSVAIDILRKKIAAGTTIFTVHIFEHMELPAKLLDYFLRSNKININEIGLMTENGWNHVCELGQSKTISIARPYAACIWHVDGGLHVTAK